MVVKPDGTKWACQSCLKGHRVSGCTHTDRELTLVPKKGRPVTQCQHCRLERKKRSAHVKCDCGEAEKPHHPKEKCIHLREAEERAKAGFHDNAKIEDDPHHLLAVAEEQGCCCHHGGKCSCSLVKREPQSQDDGTPPHGPAVPKPRLESTKSDGSITVFANGHHKPVHKRNHAAHECGMPYKMPMPRAHTDQNVTTQARRSVDSLALDSSMPWNPTQQSTASHHNERRMSKSEQHSPKQPAMTGCNGGLSDAKLSSIDFSSLGLIATNQSYDSATSDNAFPPMDPMSGMADASYDPWSAFPSADSNIPNNNPFGVWATAFDFTSNTAQPALTAASSGTQSEIDELPTMDDLYGFHMPSIQEDVGPLNNDVAGSDSNSNRRSLPPNFFGNADFSVPGMANEWQTPVNGLPSPDDGKQKNLMNDQSLGMPEAWNTPTMPTMTSIAQRPALPTSNPGRPQSHSIGPGSQPNDDMIRQLFPEFDFEGSMLGSNSPTAMDTSTNKRMGGMDMNASGGIGPMEETTAFTSQPWSDGSMSVPADAFASPYNLDQDFSSQDFTGPWPYQ